MTSPRITSAMRIAWDADRRSSGWNDKQWHGRFIDALPENATVLDLGCGGGSPVAINLVAHGCCVTGVDTSTKLISFCRNHLAGQEWLVADMRSLSLGRRFNGVLAWDSFFHLTPDDQRGMFTMFAAHAAEGTVLMFNTGAACGEALGSYRGDLLYHASLDAAEYTDLLVRSGFELVEHSVTDQRSGGRTIWLARRSAS
jgi:SAM-dependent methyltransferase